MEASLFSLINGALFLIQIGVNAAFAKDFVPLAMAHETLITPASFTFAIWWVIYLLVFVLVLVDIFYPSSSIYANATQPSQLRVCFAVTCITNILWVIFYKEQKILVACIMLFLLWLALGFLYLFTVNNRLVRVNFDYLQSMCGDLPIVLYFAWVQAMALMHLAMAIQATKDDYLSVTGAVVHLCILIIITLLAVLYAQDAMFGLVTIWYLVGIAVKHSYLSKIMQSQDLAVRTAAAEGAAIVGALLIIGTLYNLMQNRCVFLLATLFIIFVTLLYGLFG